MTPSPAPAHLAKIQKIQLPLFEREGCVWGEEISWGNEKYLWEGKWWERLFTVVGGESALVFLPRRIAEALKQLPLWQKAGKSCAIS